VSSRLTESPPLIDHTVIYVTWARGVEIERCIRLARLYRLTPLAAQRLIRRAVAPDAIVHHITVCVIE